MTDSPYAIDRGSNAGAPTTDQRGIVRPQLGSHDVGAFESRGFTLAVNGGNNQTTPINTAFPAATARVQLPAATGQSL